MSTFAGVLAHQLMDYGRFLGMAANRGELNQFLPDNQEVQTQGNVNEEETIEICSFSKKNSRFNGFKTLGR